MQKFTYQIYPSYCAKPAIIADNNYFMDYKSAKKAAFDKICHDWHIVTYHNPEENAPNFYLTQKKLSNQRYQYAIVDEGNHICKSATVQTVQ